MRLGSKARDVFEADLGWAGCLLISIKRGSSLIWLRRLEAEGFQNTWNCLRGPVVRSTALELVAIANVRGITTNLL